MCVITLRANRTGLMLGCQLKANTSIELNALYQNFEATVPSINKRCDFIFNWLKGRPAFAPALFVGFAAVGLIAIYFL